MQKVCQESATLPMLSFLSFNHRAEFPSRSPERSGGRIPFRFRATHHREPGRDEASGHHHAAGQTSIPGRGVAPPKDHAHFRPDALSERSTQAVERPSKYPLGPVSSSFLPHSMRSLTEWEAGMGYEVWGVGQNSFALHELHELRLPLRKPPRGITQSRNDGEAQRENERVFFSASLCPRAFAFEPYFGWTGKPSPFQLIRPHRWSAGKITLRDRSHGKTINFHERVSLERGFDRRQVALEQSAQITRGNVSCFHEQQLPRTTMQEV